MKYILAFVLCCGLAFGQQIRPTFAITPVNPATTTSGSGASTQVAYFTGASTLGSNSGFTTDGSGNVTALSLTSAALSSAGALALSSASGFNLTLTTAGVNGLVFTHGSNTAATVVADFTALTKSGTTTSSAAVIAKSLGLSENLYVGGLANIQSVLTVQSTSNGAITVGNIGTFGEVNIGHVGGRSDALVIGDGATAGNSTGIYFRCNGSGVAQISTAGADFAINRGNGTSEAMRITGSTGAVRMDFYGAGAATFDSSGNITSVSDSRLKDIVGPFRTGLSAIRKLRPQIYHWKPESGLNTHDVNATLIAQNLLEAGLGEAVFTKRTQTVMEEVTEIRDETETRLADFSGRLENVVRHVPYKMTRAKLGEDGKPLTRQVDAPYSVSDRAVIAAIVNSVNELDARPVADWWARAMAGAALLLAIIANVRRRAK